MRFDSSLGQETCNTTGTIMLLDNDYIAITAKAEPVPLDEVILACDKPCLAN